MDERLQHKQQKQFNPVYVDPVQIDIQSDPIRFKMALTSAGGAAAPPDPPAAGGAKAPPDPPL